MLRIGGGTEYPLELLDCRLPASIDMFSISTAPESVESFPWLQFPRFGLFEWLSDCVQPAPRNDGVDDAFCRFAQLLGEYNKPSADWIVSLLTRGESCGMDFSTSFFFCKKFESNICSFCTPDVLGCCSCIGCGWIWCVCCCFKFFSDEFWESYSRRLAISFLISFNRSRSAAKVTVARKLNNFFLVWISKRKKRITKFWTKDYFYR